MLKVSQFDGVKNQFVIETNRGQMFQSYNSAIALVDNDGKVHLSEHWNYSSTTGKYRNRFLNESIAETRAKVESGEYSLDLSLNGSILETD